jgi:DNA-binding Xre family transcriptional regulator
MINVKWKLKSFLETHGISPYKLWQESKLARGTVYTIANGKGDRIDMNTLGTILHTLERLTGLTVGLDDVLEVVRDA